jgi:signal transduction histidine kinase
VARILEEHGGAIRVEENKPIGSRFLVELPVACAAARGQADAAAEPPEKA